MSLEHCEVDEQGALMALCSLASGRQEFGGNDKAGKMTNTLHTPFVPYHLSQLFPSLAPMHPIEQVLLMSRVHLLNANRSKASKRPSPDSDDPQIEARPEKRRRASFQATETLQPAPLPALAPALPPSPSTFPSPSPSSTTTPAPSPLLTKESNQQEANFEAAADTGPFLPSFNDPQYHYQPAPGHPQPASPMCMNKPSSSGYFLPPSSPSQPSLDGRNNALKMRTTLVSDPNQVVTQMEFMKILVDSPPGTHVTDLFLFYRPGGNSRDEPLKKCARSNLLSLSNYQHDLLYSLAGCIDIKFVLSSVTSQSRNFMEINFGISREQLIIWFKNRKPKFAQSKRVKMRLEGGRLVPAQAACSSPDGSMIKNLSMRSDGVAGGQVLVSSNLSKKPPPLPLNVFLLRGQSGAGCMLGLSNQNQQINPPRIQPFFQTQIRQIIQPHSLMVEQSGNVLGSIQPSHQVAESQEIASLIKKLRENMREKLMGDPEAAALLQAAELKIRHNKQ